MKTRHLNLVQKKLLRIRKLKRHLKKIKNNKSWVLFQYGPKLMHIKKTHTHAINSLRKKKSMVE